MSELGQKRRFDRLAITSGFRREADIFRVRWNVSKVPQADTRTAANITSSISAAVHDHRSGDRKLQRFDHAQALGTALEKAQPRVIYVGSLTSSWLLQTEQSGHRRSSR
jgi:hypothetical protein